ncbi:MAG: MFS transporter [Planctomycetes bacterium]|nr:MFS transporter [Planctomycetota bacterium]
MQKIPTNPEPAPASVSSVPPTGTGPRGPGPVGPAIRTSSRSAGVLAGLPPTTYVLAFSLGHFAVDFYAALAVPLLDEFRKSFRLEEWQILAYTSTATIFGSLLQPALGLVADRFNRGAMAGLGLLLAAGFHSLSGVAPHPLVLTLFLTLGGLGVGLFHPSTAAAITQIVPGRNNLFMSVFVVSGMTGLAASGIAVTRFVAPGGVVDLGRTWMLGPAGIGLALIVFFVTRSAPGSRPEDRPRSPGGLQSAVKDFFAPEFKPVRRLWVIAFLRAFAIIAFQSFVPFLAAERQWSLVVGGGAISAVLFFLGIGGLAGGYLADWMNARRLFFASTFLPVPCLVAFAMIEGPASIAFFALAGFFIGLATPLTVVMAQELQPGKAGLISGLFLGFAWGVSGLCMPVVGRIAQSDLLGKSWTLVAVALLLFPASWMVLRLPEREKA